MTDSDSKQALAKSINNLTLGGPCIYQPFSNDKDYGRKANEILSRTTFVLTDVWLTEWDLEMGYIEAPDGEKFNVTLWHLYPRKENE